MLDTAERLPWAGHSARHALGEMYELIKRHRTTLMFVNTRSQAEMLFQELWRINDDGLAIALHHGSLDAAQRRKVEAAMAAGKLQAVVCTSSLDLGIDWGDVDLVINVGAPKGASRLTQRIGRANHRLDEPSKAVLVPANRFEVLECQAGIEAVEAGAQDTPPLRTGAFDVLAQHVLGRACGAPFLADELYDEVRTAAPFAALSREDFDAVLDFVATGGYALKVYERFAKIRQGADGRWRVANPRVAQQYRLNVGTIVEETMIKVRLVRSGHLGRSPTGKTAGSGPTGIIARGGRVLGELEEYFIEGLTPGDTFVFSGEVLRYEAMAEDEAYVSRAHSEDPKVPAYMGGKFPLSTYLAARVRDLISRPSAWSALPDQVREWLGFQQWRSVVPKPGELLVETFPRGDKSYLVCYPFEGRLAHQTLGMLLDAKARAGAAAAARLRRQRICAGRVEPRRSRPRHPHRHALARRSLRRGHAGRRPRSVACRIRADEAHVPAMRHHLRPDPAPHARRGEEAAPDDDLDRSRLRRAASPPGRPHPAARRAAGGGGRASRYQAPRHHACASQGPYRPRRARPRIPTCGAGDAGDRPRIRLWRSRRHPARRSRGGTRERGHAMTHAARGSPAVFAGAAHDAGAGRGNHGRRA